MKVRIKIDEHAGVMFYFDGKGTVFYRLDHLYKFAESLGYIFDIGENIKGYVGQRDVTFFFDPTKDANRDWLLKEIIPQLILPIAIGNYFDSDSDSQTIEIISYENTLEEKSQD
jgi:hypothetical protein